MRTQTHLPTFSPGANRAACLTWPSRPPARIRIEHPSPVVDDGRFPAKRCVGDVVEVSADIFRDGHDVLRAVVRYRAPGKRKWLEAPLHHTDAHVRGDRWAGEFTVTEMGDYTWTIEAWVDPFAAWREELERKLAFGEEDLTSEIEEGALMVEAAGLEAPARRLGTA